MALLSAENIHKSFPLGSDRLHILTGVNLEVDAGEIVALMGPSGSGKSTLLNILGTLDQPDQGRVRLDGQDVSGLTDDELSRFRNRNIGFVFQFHHLLPELTVWENVELPLRLGQVRGTPDTRFLQELIALTGLTNRINHYPAQLSGGERQRVAMIRALANRPGIVFADEPTGNLDAQNGDIIMNLIRRLREEHGQTFLIATHSQTLADGVDRRLYLDRGVINLTPLLDGSPPLE